MFFEHVATQCLENGLDVIFVQNYLCFVELLMYSVNCNILSLKSYILGEHKPYGLVHIFK